jgi:predicted DNA-binding protein YlxM (UPF0122 family)|tara:strand:- start:2536 stop:3213 length:678 start_codon:yes stop_codon:yes gene_type:complete
MGGERVVKRSCAFCTHEDRDNLEEQLLQGYISPKQLDKDMGWRTNTTDRHFRNHMGEYHMASNTSCALCTTPLRADYERIYFEDGSNIERIASELEISEDNVYHHMKHHFQPLVQKSAAVEVALVAGQEIDLLRSNAEKLNYKLSELLDEGTVHEDGFVRDAVALHKEVRETVKDLLRFQDQWGAKAEGQQVNQTFNILQVELGKESPETWSRIKNQLMENMGAE